MDDGEIPRAAGTRRASKVVLLFLLAAWCGLIFGTSSTVVTASRFFAWVEAHVFTDEASFRKFAVFWGVSWFAIVKGWHATEFAILFFLIKMALDRLDPSRCRRNRALAWAACLLFAASDEYHQTFVPARNGSWNDVAIDGLGAGLAAMASELRRRHSERGNP